jgi:hypothetical protein
MLDNSNDIEIIRVLDDICEKIEKNFKAEENVVIIFLFNF